jgi:hypothetical protein
MHHLSHQLGAGGVLPSDDQAVPVWTSGAGGNWEGIFFGGGACSGNSILKVMTHSEQHLQRRKTRAVSTAADGAISPS